MSKVDLQVTPRQFGKSSRMRRFLTSGDYEEDLIAWFLQYYPDFEFSRNPSIDPSRMTALITGSFVDAAENVLLLGATGCGKTHLSVAIACGAARRGKTVRWLSGEHFQYFSEVPVSLFGSAEIALIGADKVDFLDLSEDEDTNRIVDYLNCDLLLVDELPHARHREDPEYLNGRIILGLILSERATKGRSTLVTSSRSPGQWIEQCVLGTSTMNVLAQIHLGLFPKFFGYIHEPILGRLVKPTTGTDSELLKNFGRYPTATLREPELLSTLFHVVSPPRIWHWFHIREDSYRIRSP